MMLRKLIAGLCLFALLACPADARMRIPLMGGGSNCTTLGAITKGNCPTVIVPSAIQYQSDVSGISGLVGYWKMEDAGGCSTLADASSSGNAATISGTVTCGSTALIAGQSATSALFNGSTGFAQLGPAGGTTFNWQFNQPWTIEFLIKPNSARTGSGVFQSVFSKVLPSSPFSGFQVDLQYNGDVASKNVVTVFIQGTGTNAIHIAGSTDLSNATVWHVAVSYDGSGLAAGLNIFVNGAPDTNLVVTNTLGGTSILNSTNPVIGAWGNGSQFFLAGNLQELAIYNTAIGATTATLVPGSGITNAGKPAFHSGLAAGNSAPSTVYHPNVIFDAQIVSDAGAVTGLLAVEDFHRRGEINLVGIIIDSVNDRAADTTFAISKQLLGSGVPQTFIGAWQGAVPITNGSAGSLYSSSVSTAFGANQGRASYTDAVQKYRSLLAAQPNNSVVIIAAAYSTTLDGLLTSAANAGGDGLPSGAALITSKVIRLVFGAGCYPASATNCLAGNNPEFNLANSPPANATDVFTNWPTEVIVVGIELAGAAGTNVGNIFDGPASIVSTSTAIALSWNLWGSTPRTGWDELTVWCAIRQFASGCVPAGIRGTNTVNSTTGADAWTPATPANAPTTYLRLSGANAAFNAQFNLMYSALPAPF